MTKPGIFANIPVAAPRGAIHASSRSTVPWAPSPLPPLGIGGIIGTGIFVLTGLAAAQHAGPAVVLSFVVAGLGCIFAGLCYAEFASMVPVSGSAYAYSYATLGEFTAWFVGWNLVLEYLFAARHGGRRLVAIFRDPAERPHMNFLPMAVIRLAAEAGSRWRHHHVHRRAC